MQLADCSLICILRVTASLLRFPGRASSSALTYLQHYIRHRRLLPAQTRPSDPILVAACILLASKVEEVPISNNHLINVVTVLHELITVHHVSLSQLLEGISGPQHEPPHAPTPNHSAPSDPPQGLPSRAANGKQTDAHHTAAPGHPSEQPQAGSHAGSGAGGAHQAHMGQVTHPADHASEPVGLSPQLRAQIQGCTAVVGDSYYQSKALLLEAEQQLLRLLQWQLAVPHPAAALMHVGAVLQAPKQLLAASLTILNDVTAFSDLLLPGWPVSSNGAGRSGGGTGGKTHQAGTTGEVQRTSHGGHIQQASEAMLGGGGGDEQQEKEVVVAVACMLLASELLGGQHRIMCSVCHTAASGMPAAGPLEQDTGTDVAGRTGSMQDAVPDQCNASGRAQQGKETCGTHSRPSDSLGPRACEHWIALLGCDVLLVSSVAGEMAQRLIKTRAMVAQL